MSDRVGALWQWCRGDPDEAVAVLLTTVAVAAMPASLWRPGVRLLVALSTVMVCALVAGRRRHPVGVAVLAGLLLAIPVLTPHAAQVENSVPALADTAAVFLVAFALGSQCPWRVSLLGLAPLTIGNAVTAGTWNPLTVMLTVGPWACGLVVASRRHAQDELERLTGELEQERETFAQESVRYERTRIARELHDIVAHCVSLIVVQANAGEQLVRRDPEAAAEAFGSITVAAAETDEEIDRLVVLLGSPASTGAPDRLGLVDQLVRRARASGLTVSYQPLGDGDDLSEQGADTAYRLVQEAITNAMKHAPGAPIEVTLRTGVDVVEVEVGNRPALGAPSTLESVGGGQGLAGMQERVADCGGSMVAEPTSTGGWVVRACLPRHPTSSAAVIGR